MPDLSSRGGRVMGPMMPVLRPEEVRTDLKLAATFRVYGKVSLHNCSYKGLPNPPISILDCYLGKVESLVYDGMG